MSLSPTVNHILYIYFYILSRKKDIKYETTIGLTAQLTLVMILNSPNLLQDGKIGAKLTYSLLEKHVFKHPFKDSHNDTF